SCYFVFRLVPLFSLVVLSLLSNAPAPTDIYTLSLHDALPISPMPAGFGPIAGLKIGHAQDERALTGCTVLLFDPANGPSGAEQGDRKSTRLNSSHGSISYAVFCLKKKNTNTKKTDKHNE